MALLKLGGIITKISGKIGGTVFGLYKWQLCKNEFI